jgi:hypothetical protein
MPKGKTVRSFRPASRSTYLRPTGSSEWSSDLVQGRQQTRAKVAAFIEGAESKEVQDVGKLLLRLVEGQEEALDQVEQRLDLFLEMYFKQMIEFAEAAGNRG